MSAPNKYSNLPLKVLNRIIRRLDHVDIFKLSLVSPEWQTVIQSLHISASALSIHLTPVKFKVSMTVGILEEAFENPQQDVAHPAFDYVQTDCRSVEVVLRIPGSSEGFDANVGNVTMPLRKYKGELCTSARKLTDAEQNQWLLNLVLHLLKTFAISKLKFNASFVPKQCIVPFFSRLSYFETLHCKNTCILPSRELLKILQELTIKDLNLKWRVDPSFKYTGPLKPLTMTVDHATWLTIDSLSQIECEILKAYEVLLSSQEIHSFILKWLEGGYESLEKITLFHKCCKPHWYWQKMLDGIDTKAWKSENRPEFHGDDHAGLGYDIKRASDGLLATVIVKRNKFSFYVWHPKYMQVWRGKRPV